jgi:hypothetical protein
MPSPTGEPIGAGYFFDHPPMPESFPIATTGRLLGCDCVGSGATNLIQSVLTVLAASWDDDAAGTVLSF